MKGFLKNILAIFIGIIVSLVLAEIVLHIYNPLPSRFRGDKIQLKTNLRKKIVIEPRIVGLDSVILYSVNSLGFRGEEKPENFSEALSVITIGGSTTECSLLDDEKTWSFLLGKKLKTKNKKYWVNNAGLDGCTTYGHSILLEDYILKLKPKMILFLIGVNDMGKVDFNNEDSFLIERNESMLSKIIKKSELANLLNNLYLSYKTQKVNIGHGSKALPEFSNQGTSSLSDEQKQQLIQKHQVYLLAYKARVESLVKKCVQNNIIPVLITQPLLCKHEIMNLYNQTTLDVCAENKILCIDLANELEKKDSYFYDNIHYSNPGAEQVSTIIFNHLIENSTKK